MKRWILLGAATVSTAFLTWTAHRTLREEPS